MVPLMYEVNCMELGRQSLEWYLKDMTIPIFAFIVVVIVIMLRLTISDLESTFDHEVLDCM